MAVNNLRAAHMPLAEKEVAGCLYRCLALPIAAFVDSSSVGKSPRSLPAFCYDKFYRRVESLLSSVTAILDVSVESYKLLVRSRHISQSS